MWYIYKKKFKKHSLFTASKIGTDHVDFIVVFFIWFDDSQSKTSSSQLIGSSDWEWLWLSQGTVGAPCWLVSGGRRWEKKGLREQRRRTRRRRGWTPGGSHEGWGGGGVAGGWRCGGSWSDGVSAQRVGGPVGFGGEGQRLQLLGVGRCVSTVGGVCVLGVCRRRSGGRRQCGGGRGWGVQRRGGTGLGQLCVCQVWDGVRLCQVGAGLCVCSMCVRHLPRGDTRSLQMWGEVLFWNWETNTQKYWSVLWLGHFSHL